MNILAELSIFPLDKGESVSEYVARIIKIIKESRMQYELGPMGTCIEGEFEEIMELIKKCMYALEQDCNRIYMTLKIDYRKDRVNAIKDKISSVKKYLNK